MIDSNIVDILGAGAGLDSKRLVTQLTEIEKAPKQDAIDTKREKLDTQISDYGMMRNLLATLQDAMATVSDADTFSARGVSFPNSDAIIPTELDPGALTGNYQLSVQQVAQAQSLASTAFSAPTDAVGKGTLTISFGDWDDVVPPAAPSTFTLNGDRDPITVDITDANNSLEGLRDAINAKEAGIQASIISNGGGYQLVITAPSGENNQLQIAVADDDTVNDDASGLSVFSFAAGAFQLTQNQVGQDAELTVNGLAITRESNEIDDVITGLTFSVAKPTDVGELISISVNEDSSTAEQAIRDFVDVYNEFLQALEPLMGYNEETEEYGGLYRDPLSRSILQQIRNTIASEVAGLSDGFTTLGTMGIRTELDGSMSINETTFRKAIDENFEAVRNLFTPQVSADNALISVAGYNASTQPGAYEVIITQSPTKGVYTGSAFDVGVVFPNFDASTKDYQFSVTIDGVTSDVLTIPQKVYASEDDVALEIQALINADSNLSSANVAVDVAILGGVLSIESRAYGSKSTVAITSDDGANSLTELGLAVASGSAGKDVAGSIDGVTAFGLGNVLLPKLDSDPYGMKLTVSEGATGTSSVTFSRGFGGTMFQLIDAMITNNGLISNREDNIERDLERLDDEQSRLDRRIEAYNARLLAQYSAMDAIVQSLNTTRDYLSNILKTLPYTSQDN